MPAKICLFLLLAAAAVAAPGVPAYDARNTVTPGTNTHFQFEAPASLEVWQQRRGHLRTQILAAAGLLPLPEKTAMHPQIFGRIGAPGYTIEKVLLDTLPD